MAHHSLYPGYLKLKYIVNSIEHVQTIPIRPVEGWVVGEEPSVYLANDTPIALSTAITNYLIVFKPFHATTTDIVSVECWFYETEESDPIWVYTHEIGEVGTGAATALLMGQAVFSFRTAGGNVLKAFIMEPSSNVNPNQRQSYPWPAGLIANYGNYVISSASIFRGRDGFRPVTGIWMTTKYNDALRKRRLLL